MNNTKILNSIGESLITECFESSRKKFESVRNHKNPPEIYSELSNMLKRINNLDFAILEKGVVDVLSGYTFNILRFFEEQSSNPNGKFRLIYEEDGVQYDLTEISENLKAEPIIEGGWIDRFSKYGRVKE